MLVILRKISPWFLLVFLLILLLATCPLLNWQIPKILFRVIFFLSIILAGITFWFSRKEVEPAMLSKKDLLKVAIVLFLIILIFVGFKKISYLGQMMFDMKYMAYVEPAKNMVEESDPFLVIKQYRARFFHDPPGENRSFGNFPILIWPLAVLFSLFKNVFSYELLARGLMALWGIGTLLAIYLAIKEYTNERWALFPVLFLAVSPLFHLISYKTVLDTPMLCFLFLSLYFLGRYLKNKKPILIFWAGIFSGLTILAKIDGFLILFPAALVLLIYAQRQFARLFSLITIFTFLTFSPWLVFKLLIDRLPSAGSKEIFLSLLGVAISLVLLIVIAKRLAWINQWLTKIGQILLKKKIYLLVLVVGLILLSYLIIQGLKLGQMADTFLTDSRLILNWGVYDKIINNDLKKLVGSSFFCLFWISIVAFLLWSKEKRLRIFIFSLLIGGLVFLIAASKSIFFHNYYQAYFVILVLITVGLFVPYFASLFSSKFLKVVIVALLLVLLGSNIFRNIQKVKNDTFAPAGKEREYQEAVRYLKEQTQPGQGFWEGHQTHTLAMYADRPGYQPGVISQGREGERFKREVEKEGLFKALNRQGVYYYINGSSIDSQRSWLNLANWLAGRMTGDEVFDRGATVLEVLSGTQSKDKTKSDLTSEEKELLKRYQFEKHMVLEKEIGNFKFYRIKP